MFFNALVAPLEFIGVIVILITWFGWPGIIIICVIAVLMPVQILVGKINSRYF